LGKEKLKNVTLRSGTTVSFPEEEADEIVSRGEAVPEAEEAAIARKQAHDERIAHSNTEDKIQAFGEGILGSLSLGVTDHFFEDAGKRAEYNKSYRTGGELLGLAGGIAGSTGKGPLSFITPSSVLFKGSTKAGGFVSNVIGKRITEGVIEGGALGAAQVISESGLSNSPLTYENIAGGVGTGALTGGGIGALFGAGQRILNKKAAERVNPFFNDAGEGSAKYGQAYDGQLQNAHKEIHEHLRLRSHEDLVKNRVDTQVFRVQEADEAAVRAVEGRINREAIREARVPSGTDTVSGKAGARRADDVAARVTPADDANTLTNPKAVDPDNIRPPGQLRNVPAANRFRTARGDLDDAVKRYNEREAAKAAGTADTVAATTADLKRVSKAQRQTKDIKAAVSDTAKFSPGTQRRIAAADTEVVAGGAVTKGVRSTGEAGGIGVSDPFRQLLDYNNAWMLLREANEEAFKFSKIVKKTNSEAVLAAQALDNYIGTVQRLDGQLGTNFGDKLVGIHGKIAPLLPAEVNVVLQRLNAVDPVDLAAVLKADPKVIAGMGQDARELLGAYVLGRAGVSNQAKAAVKDFKKWVNKTNQAAKSSAMFRGGLMRAAAAPFVFSSPFMWLHVAQVAGNVAIKAERAMRKFVVGGPRATLKRQALTAATVKPLVDKALFDIPDFIRKETKVPGNIGQRMAEISYAVSNPTAIKEQIDDMLIPIRAVNMDMGFKVSDIIMNRLAYLHDKLPKTPIVSPFVQSEWQPSADQVESWARYFQAAEDPIGTFERELKSGMVSIELAETLKTLYPETFVYLQKIALDEATKNPPSYQVRMALSTLFDLELDPAANVQFGRTMQTSHKLSSQGGPQGGIPVSQTALRENVLNTQTKGQRLIER
jgi:hypothetical protein